MASALAAVASRASQTSRASLAPSYYSNDTSSEYESELPRSEAGSPVPSDAVLDMEEPPAYSPATRFMPTVSLQIETAGKSAISLPVPPQPRPIPVYDIDPHGAVGDARFLSLRAKRRSGTSTLVDGADQSVVRSCTTYRFGPGRNPQVKLLSPAAGAGAGAMLEMDVEDGEDGQVAGWDDFEVKRRGLLSRAVRLRTRLGTFEWRYASRAERRAAGADSLLVLDRVLTIAVALDDPATSSLVPFRRPKDEEVRTQVARLVRNDEFRSSGSSRNSAGNGGRLFIDLGIWDESEKTEREMAVVMIATTCLAMLKREVDRRRGQQIAIMAGAAGAS